MSLIEKYLHMLHCPDCRGVLEIADDQLKCLQCNNLFKIVNDIPIFLPSSLDRSQELSIKYFGSEYVELLNKKDYNFDDKYSQNDVKIIKKTSISFKNYLEVGCGRGRNCVALAREKKRNIIGLDLSIEALLLAQKIAAYHNVEIFLVCGDMKRMPFRDDIFDICFGGGSLEHFEETEDGIRHIYEVLKPGGFSIMTVPCVSILTCFQGLLTGNIPKVFPLKHLYYFLHHKILRGRYLMFGFEYSFLPKFIKRDFKKIGFSTAFTELYDVDYDLKFVPTKLKSLVRKLIKRKLFWPMITVIAKK